MTHARNLTAGEDRRGGLGGHECDPSQTKRAGIHYLAHSQQGEQRGYFGGLFGY